MKAPAPSLQGRCLLAMAGVLALGFVGFLWWLTSHQPAVRFLPHHAPADWIVFPNPPEATARTITARSATFRRTFTIQTLPEKVVLALRVMTGCELAINGIKVELPSTPNWKQPQELVVQDRLHAGDNRIEIQVHHDAGPPALWLHVHGDGLELLSDERWEVSYAGSAWKMRGGRPPPCRNLEPATRWPAANPP